MRLSTLILSKSAKSNDKKGYYPCTLSGERFSKKTGNIMKIRLDFKRGNSHVAKHMDVQVSMEARAGCDQWECMGRRSSVSKRWSISV